MHKRKQIDLKDFMLLYSLITIQTMAEILGYDRSEKGGEYIEHRLELFLDSPMVWLSSIDKESWNRMANIIEYQNELILQAGK